MERGPQTSEAGPVLQGDWLSAYCETGFHQATGSSDVDLPVEFDRPVGLFGLFKLQDHLEKLLGCRVDVGTPDSLKLRIRSQLLAERIDVS